MSYCIQSDIENVFGEDNVRKWSNLDNDDDTVNTTRVGQAILFADGEINDAFRDSRYVVPLQGASGTLYTIKDMAAKLAGIWLYESRGNTEFDQEGRPFNRYYGMKKDVHAKIRKYLAGKARLDAIVHDHGTTAPFVTG